MSEISVFGAGAFGTALAVSLALNGNKVHLIARSKSHADIISKAGENADYLPGIPLPEGLTVTANTKDPALLCLVAVPTQALPKFVQGLRGEFVGRTVVACCKGVDLQTGSGPTATILNQCPASEAAILSGPGFAIDIGGGLPTALTIASHSEATATFLQHALSTDSIRLYRSTDVVGVELGGALKNVMAISAGIAIGAGLGESARAALIARGFEELVRFAKHKNANPTTLSGLSGLGDLVLTCTSNKSRNFTYGVELGHGSISAVSGTVEGVPTALAVDKLARAAKIEMPITSTVAALIAGEIATGDAIQNLLSRPLKKE